LKLNLFQALKQGNYKFYHFPNDFEFKFDLKLLNDDAPIAPFYSNSNFVLCAFFKYFLLPIQLLIKKLDGSSFTIKVDEFSFISFVKVKIFEQEGISTDHQNLIFEGKVLQDYKELWYYSIKEDSQILLIQSPSLNIQSFLFITITINYNYFYSFKKEFNPLDTIGDLKSFLIEIAAERGEFISYSNISVDFNLKTISNDTSIDSINLSSNSILNFIDLSNGCGFQIYIQKPDNSKFLIYIHPDFTISDVKRKFSFYQEIPFAQQKLIFNQTILENQKSVSHYSMKWVQNYFLN
jgi:ubiquitin C